MRRSILKSKMNPWAPEVWSATTEQFFDPTLPLITIGILSFNRCDDLRRTLDVITRAVQYQNFEVLVVDNGSSDGSLEMMKREFPTVRIHEVGKNLGVSARNFQTELARGKYLFSFDDDSFPGTPSMILRIVQYMEAHPDIDSMSTACYQPATGQTETKGWEFYRLRKDAMNGFQGIYIVEGGICFRLASLRAVDGYDTSWPYGSEGMDLGLQFYGKGFTSSLCPWFLTLHYVSPAMRVAGRRTYMNARHILWMIAKEWPLQAAIPLIGVHLLRRIFSMWMHPKLARYNAKGLLDGLKGVRPFVQHQPKLTWSQIYKLKRFYLFLFRWG
jgi:GT2 family glycosyltransferase